MNKEVGAGNPEIMCCLIRSIAPLWPSPPPQKKRCRRVAHCVYRLLCCVASVVAHCVWLYRHVHALRCLHGWASELAQASHAPVRQKRFVHACARYITIYGKFGAVEMQSLEHIGTDGWLDKCERGNGSLAANFDDLATGYRALTELKL